MVIAIMVFLYMDSYNFLETNAEAVDFAYNNVCKCVRLSLEIRC